MLIQITNTCTFMCKHCLQDSNPEPQHMSDGLFVNALMFSRMSGSRTVILSGGEPTEHPSWAYYTDVACNCTHDCKQIVILVSNGKWLGTPNEKEMLRLLSNYDNLYLQVTSVPDFYPNSGKIVDAFDKFYENLPEEIKDRVDLTTKLTSIVTLGRASRCKMCIDTAKKDKSKMMSCFSSNFVAIQTDFINAIRHLELNGLSCHPLVDWKGGLHWSESWLCPSFFTIPEHVLLDEPMFDQIAEAACNVLPCCKCADYEKLRTNNYPKYVLAKYIMGKKKAHLEDGV